MLRVVDLWMRDDVSNGLGGPIAQLILPSGSPKRRCVAQVELTFEFDAPGVRYARRPPYVDRDWVTRPRKPENSPRQTRQECVSRSQAQSRTQNSLPFTEMRISPVS